MGNLLSDRQALNLAEEKMLKKVAKVFNDFLYKWVKDAFEHHEFLESFEIAVGDSSKAYWFTLSKINSDEVDRICSFHKWAYNFCLEFNWVFVELHNLCKSVYREVGIMRDILEFRRS